MPIITSLKYKNDCGKLCSKILIKSCAKKCSLRGRLGFKAARCCWPSHDINADKRTAVAAAAVDAGCQDK